MQSHSTVRQSTLTDAVAPIFLAYFGTKSAILAGVGEELDLSVEDQLSRLRQRVVEDRASREAAEKAQLLTEMRQLRVELQSSKDNTTR